MVSSFKSLIEKEVDRQFSEIEAEHGEICDLPITGASIVWGVDPIAPEKEYAMVALLAREWFAVNGPPDAPPLPLYNFDSYRGARGLKGVVGFYARSLSRQGYGRQSFDVCNHPSFDDFARGLMAINTGLWRTEKDENLKKRFPPRLLEGMTPSAFWAPPEEYAELMASYRRAELRELRWAEARSN
jgi:hypothetical protein